MNTIYIVSDGDFGVIAAFQDRKVLDLWLEKSSFRYGATVQELTLNEDIEFTLSYDYKESYE